VPHEAPQLFPVPVAPVQKRSPRQQSELKEHGLAAHDEVPAGLHSRASQFPLQHSLSSKQNAPVDSQVVARQTPLRHELPLQQSALCAQR
jgi:hypothetical protein